MLACALTWKCSWIAFPWGLLTWTQEQIIPFGDEARLSFPDNDSHKDPTAIDRVFPRYASWALKLREKVKEMMKEIKRVRVLVRVTTSGSLITLHTLEHWTAEKVHLSGIYLLHNAHATNDKVEAHSDEEDGELINNPILLVGYEYALVVVIATGLVLTVGQ
ncbi:hypothetical protein ACJX0J_013500, partial [Zea mays]